MLTSNQQEVFTVYQYWVLRKKSTFDVHLWSTPVFAISQQWLLTSCQRTVDVYSTLIFSVRAKSKKARSCQHPGYAPKFFVKSWKLFLTISASRLLRHRCRTLLWQSRCLNMQQCNLHHFEYPYYSYECNQYIRQVHVTYLTLLKQRKYQFQKYTAAFAEGWCQPRPPSSVV